MNTEEHSCAFCVATPAPATTSILRQPACGACGEAIAMFYRCEHAAVAKQAREEKKT